MAGLGLACWLMVMACGCSENIAPENETAPGAEHPRSARQFGWPVTVGYVSSGFGMRHGAMHHGIDIAAPSGTPVHAADSGVVIYAGWLRGYGNVVIIRHSLDYVTVYAHNQANLVREGQEVRRSQVIAQVGRTGRATGPNLHFEVRYDNVAENPLSHLPYAPPAASAFMLAHGSR